MKKSQHGRPLKRYLIALTLFMGLLGCEHREKEQDASVEPAHWYVTTLDQKQLLQPHAVGRDDNAVASVNIQVDSLTVFQEMDGFGYTLTGGSAM
ncbi:MAG: hypothetical protein WBN39_01610, partial [Flavobacteriaceae bacterium]